MLTSAKYIKDVGCGDRKKNKMDIFCGQTQVYEEWLTVSMKSIFGRKCLVENPGENPQENSLGYIRWFQYVEKLRQMVYNN
jgi:hypothetical protein